MPAMGPPRTPQVMAARERRRYAEAAPVRQAQFQNRHQEAMMAMPAINALQQDAMSSGQRLMRRRQAPVAFAQNLGNVLMRRMQQSQSSLLGFVPTNSGGTLLGG